MLLMLSSNSIKKRSTFQERMVLNFPKITTVPNTKCKTFRRSKKLMRVTRRTKIPRTEYPLLHARSAALCRTRTRVNRRWWWEVIYLAKRQCRRCDRHHSLLKSSQPNATDSRVDDRWEVKDSRDDWAIQGHWEPVGGGGRMFCLQIRCPPCLLCFAYALSSYWSMQRK